jgi:predicted mannosyl-3-phosphoglycerate phosphatase (HAD superfamily)
MRLGFSPHFSRFLGLPFADHWSPVTNHPPLPLPWFPHHRSAFLRSTTTVVFCAIDDLISLNNKALTGFPEFLEGLGDASIPLVPVTTRSRLQFDAALRKFGLGHPFLAEGGCAVYLPEDYFHLKPPHTTRLGRFTCIPVAEPQPAAAEALETLAEQTGIEIVALRNLSPRELAQNVGLPQREAELLRQRDFDELFFFAGASDADIRRFQEEAAQARARLRPRGTLWSLAVGANTASCVRELSQLYRRSFHAAPLKIGLATAAEESAALLPSCDRCLFLTARDAQPPPPAAKCKTLPLFSPDTWPLALQGIVTRQL